MTEYGLYNNDTAFFADSTGQYPGTHHSTDLGPGPYREVHTGGRSNRPHISPSAQRPIRQQSDTWYDTVPDGSAQSTNQHSGWFLVGPNGQASVASYPDMPGPPTPLHGGPLGRTALLEDLAPGALSRTPHMGGTTLLSTDQQSARPSHASPEHPRRHEATLVPLSSYQLAASRHDAPPSPSWHSLRDANPPGVFAPSPLPSRPATASGAIRLSNETRGFVLTSPRGNGWSGSELPTADHTGPSPGSLTPPMSPILRISNQNIVLTPEQLRAELRVLSRHGIPWAYWEHHNLIIEVVGPRAPRSRFEAAMGTPRKPDQENLPELDPVWSRICAVSFNGLRKVTALVARWWVLVDQHDAIVAFAEYAGIDIYLPIFRDTRLLVNRIIARWKQCVPSGSWGILTSADMAAWTHNLDMGWFSMMHKRLRDWGAARPDGSSNESDVHTFSDSDTFLPMLDMPHSPSHTGSNPTGDFIVPSAQSPRAQSAGPSYQYESLAENGPSHPSQSDRTIPTGEAVVRHTSVAPREPADEWHMSANASMPATTGEATLGLGDMMALEESQTKLRMTAALSIINSDCASQEFRQGAESWYSKTFFSTHPSNDFARSLIYWQRRLGERHGIIERIPAGLREATGSTHATAAELSSLRS